MKGSDKAVEREERIEVVGLYRSRGISERRRVGRYKSVRG